MNADVIKPATHRTKSIKEMPEPTLLSDPMNFVYGVAWFRNHIPYFAELPAPMYDTWNLALKDKKKKTMAAAMVLKLGIAASLFIKDPFSLRLCNNELHFVSKNMLKKTLEQQLFDVLKNMF